MVAPQCAVRKIRNNKIGYANRAEQQTQATFARTAEQNAAHSKHLLKWARLFLTKGQTMPNNYVDTRGICKTPVAFTEAVVNGLATGGGLYVPEHIPHMNLDEIIELGNLSYAERAAKVYKLFEVDMPDELIDELMKSAYGAQFDSKEICPIESLDEDTHILNYGMAQHLHLKTWLCNVCLGFSLQA